ncbi:MAG: adenosylcobalamin-dependent ribonucleoside-diphosphate reductase [Elusimicrobiota bacterium]
MPEKKYSPLAEDLLKKRYLREGESPSGMFRRVAAWIARAEKENSSLWEEKYYEVMENLDFLPNSPCLMNAGTSMPQLAACFVYPVEDSLESIFDTLKISAMTHKSGGGTGFSFSRLRPRGDRVGKTGGTTSGPVSFMEIYDKATEAIRQGGRRRGANMGILRVDHPDIEEFIDAKQAEGRLRNFNISVAVTDEFMDALKSCAEYDLYFPSECEKRGKKDAKYIFEKIRSGAWKNGEPGIIFIDRINRKNPLPGLGRLEATNPCGEMPLLPYEACVLGSVNLSSHAVEGAIDWDKLKRTVNTAVRFLDDAIDVSDFPMKEITEIVRANRKIGLGVMGFASMLMKLEIPYASAGGVKMARKVMKFISGCAHEASEKLAEEKGEFPNFNVSDLKKKRRNSLVTTIAPTGSISIIAGTSSGIEPVYSLSVRRRTEDGRYFDLTDPVVEEVLERRGLPVEKVIADVIQAGSMKISEHISQEVRKVFLTATEIEPRVHVLIQAAFQKYVDNAISKTVNVPDKTTVEEAGGIIIKAYRTGCKGITLYRQNTRRQQVLNIICDCEDTETEYCSMKGDD